MIKISKALQKQKIPKLLVLKHSRYRKIFEKSSASCKKCSSKRSRRSRWRSLAKMKMVSWSSVLSAIVEVAVALVKVVELRIAETASQFPLSPTTINRMQVIRIKMLSQTILVKRQKKQK